MSSICHIKKRLFQDRLSIISKEPNKLPKRTRINWDDEKVNAIKRIWSDSGIPKAENFKELGRCILPKLKQEKGLSSVTLGGLVSFLRPPS